MKLVIQRCKEAKVTVNNEITGKIESGLMILVGVHEEDSEEDVRYVAEKAAHLRIFEDAQGKMNLSLLDIGGGVLSVSQFTLYGDCRKGRRPNFMAAARPEQALHLYEAFNEALRGFGIHVETGRFGEMMDVTFTNWGPVTLIIDSRIG
jgi:D-tyrosyl-tRNA(Tyr) deacylase